MILLTKDSEAEEYAKKYGPLHAERLQAHPGDKQREGQMNEIRHCACKRERSASEGPQPCCSVAAFLPQFARIASKANTPAWNAHLGIKRISAEYPKVL